MSLTDSSPGITERVAVEKPSDTIVGGTPSGIEIEIVYNIVELTVDVSVWPLAFRKLTTKANLPGSICRSYL
jgi:hypothetical protein